MRPLPHRAAALLLIAALAAGCGGDDDPAAAPTSPVTSSAAPSQTSSPGAGEPLGSPVVPEGQDPQDFRAEVALDDGARVAAYLVAGTGLVVQVRPAGQDDWSAPATLVESSEDPCQGVELQQAGGTVALTAGFGLYCYDGEPPQQVVAAALAGVTDAWDVRTIDDVDDFESVTVAGDGGRVDFDGSGGTITWTKGRGFD